MSDPQRKDVNPQHGRGPMVVRIGPVRSAQELIQPVQPPEQPKPQRKRSKSRLVGALSAVLSLLAVIGVVGAGGAILAQREFQTPGPLQTDKVVVIPRDSGLDDIAELLAREGVINQPTLFMIKAQLQKLSKDGHALRAGEYQFKQQASLNSVVETLTTGQALTHAVTIAEGLTSEQIVGKLRDYDFLIGETADVPLEGSLAPTTFRFERGTHRQRVIERLRRLQQETVKDVWEKRSRDLPLKSPQEMVILASIVEKETGRADERPRIAGVFINRLNKNMRLQSDPTTVYGIVGGKGPLGRSLTRADLDQVTAYNTYAITGLPPGPIANPGRAALEAVANPSRTKELYFVADGSGGHAFAETLDQHNRNVQRWRQLEAQKDQAPAPGAVVPGTVAPGAPATSPPAQQPVSPPQFGPAVPQQRTQLDQPVPGGRPAVPSAFARATQPQPPAAQKLPARASAYAIPSLEVTGLDDLLGAEGAAAAGSSRALEPDKDDVIKKVDSWPVPEKMRARLQQLPPGGGVPEMEAEPQPAQQAAVSAPPTRPRAFDAVAGTKLDPLRNQSYDLSTAKTVPTFR